MSTGDPRRYRDDSPVSRERGFCPCCGYRTLTPDTPGSYEVCPVCYWLDDFVAFYLFRGERPAVYGVRKTRGVFRSPPERFAFWGRA